MAAAAVLLREIETCFSARSLFQWGIARQEHDDVIGSCTLASITPEHHRAEIGFALARAHWGRGFIAEALPALVNYALYSLGLHRLEADVDPRNAASIRALERLGFRREGRCRERYHLHGEVQDALMYGLLATDWEGGASQLENAECR